LFTSFVDHEHLLAGTLLLHPEWPA